MSSCMSATIAQKGKDMALRLRVKELAESKGFNISTLSRKADVGLSTIRRLWRDPYRSVDFYVLERIAKALEVPATELIEDVPDKEE
jgi:DNA-binding Xre family transcriptional regulator